MKDYNLSEEHYKLKLEKESCISAETKKKIQTRSNQIKKEIKKELKKDREEI